MEEVLDCIVSVKKKMRDNIYEKFDFFMDNNSCEINVLSKNSCFEGVSELANNKEYIKLNKEYEYLNFIEITINNFIKIKRKKIKKIIFNKYYFYPLKYDKK